jgi:hypothetical protein
MGVTIRRPVRDGKPSRNWYVYVHHAGKRKSVMAGPTKSDALALKAKIEMGLRAVTEED